MLSFNIGKDLKLMDVRESIDNGIRKRIPFGTDVRATPSKYFNKDHFVEDVKARLTKLYQEFTSKFGLMVNHQYFSLEYFEDMCRSIGANYGRVMNSIGTLGGGNHFIEIGKSENTGDYWVTIHSGSRNLGKCVCEYWQDNAAKRLDVPTKNEYTEMIKTKYPKRHWQDKISKYNKLYPKNKYAKGTEFLLAGSDMHMYMYLCHMAIAQAYADYNRDVMMQEILGFLGVVPSEVISTIHNFVDFNDWIIRKGAIRSYIGEKMIIPFNMEDGIIICEGKSNPDWNYSAPHGAGRLYSRSMAKEVLSADEAASAMKEKDIYTSNIPLDEVRAAYKDPKVIEQCIEPTATIIDRLIPVLNMKE
jgi:RNA-splicing ligase RtcB